jgi:4-carboxymuconolactone decarboxylase
MLPRIHPLDPPYDSGLAEELAAMMPPGVEPLGLFRTLARNRRVLGRIRGGNLLDRGSISRRDREIVILRTCARCGSEYEWGVHAAFFAERFAIDQALLTATVHDDANAFESTDALLVRLVDELHETATLSDALWTELVAHWNEEQLIEFVVLTGFYHTISFVTQAFGVANEPFAARFPESSTRATTTCA